MSGSRSHRLSDRSDAGRVFDAVPNSTTPPFSPTDRCPPLPSTPPLFRLPRRRRSSDRRVRRRRSSSSATAPKASRCCCRAAPSAATTTAAPGSFPAASSRRTTRLRTRPCAGLDDAEASRRLGLANGGLDYYVAAIRECFEESGLLFARADAPALVDLDGSDAVAPRALARRAASRRERHRRVLRCRRPAPGGRPARLPQPLADAARPRQALRHALLHRRRAGGADRRPRRRRAARADVDRAQGGARAQARR